MNPGSPKISVVIPTLNEADHLPRTLASIPRSAEVEIIVVDGGSSDATVKLAHEGAHHVLTAPRGRATQMNAGAAEARGEILLFLHADTRLPPNVCHALQRVMRSPIHVGGAFRLRIDSPRWSLRLISLGANGRSRLLKLPFGDQALFVRREIFAEIQGFRQVAIMEDVDLVRRLKRKGRLVMLSEAVVTSARRWDANGVVRTTLVHLLVSVLFLLRVPLPWLRRVYDGLLLSGRDPQTAFPQTLDARYVAPKG